MKTPSPLILLLLAASLFAVSSFDWNNNPHTKPVQTGTPNVEINSHVAIYSGDTADYYNNRQLRYDDHVYEPNYNTVLLHRRGFELSQPLLVLGSEDQLHLSFDDLSQDYKDLAFELIHCDASWKPSDLMAMEYIEGLPYDYITDYAFSNNTLEQYIHYNLYFPRNNMQITRSGNYVIKVYDNDNPEDVVITRRFMVVDKLVRIDGRVRAATRVEDRFSKQEVDFSVYWDRYQLTSPYQDVKVVLLQNGRWDNAIFNLEPRFVKDKELDYNHDGDNTFPGGNEYRFFDTRNIRYQAATTDSIRFSDDDRREHVYLEPDRRRSARAYLDNRDINGKRLIKVDRWNAETDADYTYIHFFLPWDEQELGGDFYINGALADWQLSNKNKLRYNKKRKGYEASLYLKQGYYNYEYVFLRDGKRAALTSTVEGSHYQTENNYTILVYHRSYGGNFDQLVAAEVLNSRDF